MSRTERQSGPLMDSLGSDRFNGSPDPSAAHFDLLIYMPSVSPEFLLLRRSYLSVLDPSANPNGTRKASRICSLLYWNFQQSLQEGLKRELRDFLYWWFEMNTRFLHLRFRLLLSGLMFLKSLLPNIVRILFRFSPLISRLHFLCPFARFRNTRKYE